MGVEIMFDEDQFIVSKTDLQGRITYGNELFINISGYNERELLGTQHSIVRHADMPKSIFKLLWNTIQKGDEIIAFVKNKTRHNDYYWVEAQATPSFDSAGSIIGYHSVRRKPKRESVAFFDKFYKELLSIEQRSGVDAGLNHINGILKSKGMKYEQFILNF